MVMVDEARAARIADIGRRANALRRAGFYDASEVRWLAEYVRSDAAPLVEVEALLADAELQVAAAPFGAAAN
jgi:hypothetical protein